MFSHLDSQHFFVSSLIKASRVQGFGLTKQELVDGYLITSSCPPLSDEEVLLNIVFKQLAFIN